MNEEKQIKVSATCWRRLKYAAMLHDCLMQDLASKLLLDALAREFPEPVTITLDCSMHAASDDVVDG